MKAKWYIFLAAILVIIAFGRGAVVWLTDWIWLQQVGYAGIIVKSIGYRLLSGLMVGLVSFLVLYVNLTFVTKTFRRLRVVDIGPDGSIVENSWVSRTAIVISVAAGVISGLAAWDRWMDILSFLNPVPFGVDDPLHGLDVSFYVFRLPLMHALYSYALSLLTAATILVCAGYLISGSVSISSGRLRMNPRALAHVSVLVFLVFIVRAIGYRLDVYDLVYSTRGMTYGAGYTDARVIMLGYNLMTVISVIAALAVLLDAASGRLKFLVPSVVGLIAVSLVFTVVIPGAVERFRVRPNQAQLESPYIEAHIQMTRAAYGLDDVEEMSFAVTDDLTAADLQANQDIVSNIRLWDWRPLLDTYTQTQSNKAYYQFNEVDIDRYTINGRYRQVMLSGREINPDAVPGEARNWINRHLVYTHGYGLVMSYSTEISDEGFPVYAISGLPLKSEPGLEVTRPQIYYGEKTNDYVIVNSDYRGVGEFDYPTGDQNAYIKYDGTGGIPLSSPLVKALFALRFGSADILLADAITKDSRLMIYRNIAERVRQVAPFLRYDADPYLVLVDGELFWIVDAYTTTSLYPYSQPYPGWGNYVRNSIKAVVNAYDGSIAFYRFDESDPIAALYDRVFPGFFTDLAELSDGLRAHFRYPETLFSIQADMLGVYHMTDVSVFYNKEDQWRIPVEQYQSTTARVEPYYTITKLPGRDTAEYVLMIPYSPEAKSNMTAFLVAGCDGDNYGRLSLFRFPRGETIKGPLQIENLIDGDDEISRDLTLWNQQGSRVIRGNLLVVPIENSLLYVEPIFLEPEGTPFPVLKRVVVSYASRVVAAETLDACLRSLFDSFGYLSSDQEGAPEESRGPAAQEQEGGAEATALSADHALRLFNEAREAIQRNDWSTYGKKLEELERVLNELARESVSD